MRWWRQRRGEDRADIPVSATFRRAEGLEFDLSACAPEHVEVTARRHGGDTRTRLSREQFRALVRCERWRTASDAGLSHEELVGLVADNLCFFSRVATGRHLDSPVEETGGTRVLRRNAWPKLLVRREGKVDTFPFMSRRGMLDDAQVVGVQFSVFEWGRATYRVRVACCTDHGARWRDVLAGASDPELWSVLDDARLVDTVVVQPPAWDGVQPQVTWLSHAGVLVECAGTRILCDPLFHPISRPARAGADIPPDPRHLGRVDAVLITHGDNDHFNPQALPWLPRSVPVLVPAVAHARPWQVDMEGLLRVLGFTDVRALPWWDTTRVGPVEVQACPFRGESWGLELPACTWLVRHPSLCVYLDADCEFMPDVFERIGRENVVDLALLGVTGCAEAHLSPPGFGYGNFYAMWIPPAQRNQWIELCAGPAESARAARLLNARHAFGYAAGGAGYEDMAFSDRGSHAEMADIMTAAGDAARVVDLRVGVPWAVPPRA